MQYTILGYRTKFPRRFRYAHYFFNNCQGTGAAPSLANTPFMITALAGRVFATFAASREYVIAVERDGSVWSWGYNAVHFFPHSYKYF